MSKLWLLLLFVGAIQFARAYPALEEEDEDVADFFDMSSYEFDFDDLSDEARGSKVGDWIKGKWEKMKNQFKKVGEKIKRSFNKGREYLKKKGIKIDPLNCSGNTCKSCVEFTLKKKKFCAEAKFADSAISLSLTKQKDQEEAQVVLGPYSIQLNGECNCLKKPLGKFIGPICLSGVEGRAKSSDGKPLVNFCGVVLIKNFNVGFKFCVGYENKKFTYKFSPKLFPGEEDGKNILEAGEKEDEGKPVDAVPE
uniref:Venom redulysin 2 n=1 Tax=Ectomocoris sp. TaxID=3104572 RepID=A0AB38ZE66_9HEMI